MTYDQIAMLLRKLEARFGWEPIVEDGRIIGVQLDGQSVTLEPGGQFELSGAPVETIHTTCAEVNSHLYQVSAALPRSGSQRSGYLSTNSFLPPPHPSCVCEPWRHTTYLPYITPLAQSSPAPHLQSQPHIM
jgi:hypothetical protein